jgi:hypothetical protein
MADAAEQSTAEHRSLVTQTLTTEHFALQSARGAIATESVGRATMYLGTVSSALVAMGFLAQLLHLNPMFATTGALSLVSSPLLKKPVRLRPICRHIDHDLATRP